MNRVEIEEAVRQHAATLLREKGYVSPVDLLLCLQWLSEPHLREWRLGRVPYLERVVMGNLSRIGFVLGRLRDYGQKEGLRPSWTAYVKWGKGTRHPLRFSKSGDPHIERAYATHYVGNRPGGRESGPDGASAPPASREVP